MPPRGGVPCRGGEACVTLRSPELCRREPCTPGRSNHARLVCVVRVQTKAAPKGRKTLTENHWPSRSWGLGGRPITCPQKIQKITETVTCQEQIRNGEAVAMDGGTAGHTMTSVGKSLREAHRPTRSLATPKSKMRVGCWNVRTMYTVGKAAQVA